MRYLSVCSGIEAASVAWGPLGWKAVGVSEIEPFPCSVLKHHYPDVPNFGDMTQFEEWDIEPGAVDVLVGGTPCQSFSIAGLRGGLEDGRGNLALTYCRILQKFKPRWFIWENVPGVFSSWSGDTPSSLGIRPGQGRTMDLEETSDFASIIGAFSELGYGVAARILDAQYFGVPQRRRRIFVVGYLGDWRCSAEVLFESGCLRGNSPKSGKKRKDVAGTLASRTSAGGGLGTDFDLGGGLVSAFDSYNIATSDTFGAHTTGTGTAQHNCVLTSTGNTSHCLNAGGMGRQDYETETMVVIPIDMRQASRGEKFTNNRSDGSSGGPPGIGIGGPGEPSPTVGISHTPAIAVSSFRTAGDGAAYDSGDKTAALTTATDPNANIIAFSGRDRGDDGRGYGREPNVTGDITETVDATKPPRVAGPSIGVRRLTPRECERLQGFPDDYTLVPVRKASVKAVVDGTSITFVEGIKMQMAADGPRYKSCGNSMAVPVMAWLGKRIEIVNARIKAESTKTT